MVRKCGHIIRRMEGVFQLRPEEKQEVVANCDNLAKIKFSSTLPYAFTEHGAIKAANVINSDRAIEMGLFVVRAFVRLRSIMSTHQDLSQKLAQLERHLIAHDQQLAGIVAAVRSLLGKKEIPNKRRIGFSPDGE